MLRTCRPLVSVRLTWPISIALRRSSGLDSGSLAGTQDADRLNVCWVHMAVTVPVERIRGVRLQNLSNWVRRRPQALICRELKLGSGRARLFARFDCVDMAEKFLSYNNSFLNAAFNRRPWSRFLYSCDGQATILARYRIAAWAVCTRLNVWESSSAMCLVGQCLCVVIMNRLGQRSSLALAEHDGALALLCTVSSHIEIFAKPLSKKERDFVVHKST